MRVRTPFESSSYLVQVRRLRTLAREVIKFYPIQAKRLEFINHGENTTFKDPTQPTTALALNTTEKIIAMRGHSILPCDL